MRSEKTGACCMNWKIVADSSANLLVGYEI